MLTALLAVGREPAASDVAVSGHRASPGSPYLHIKRDVAGITIAGQVSSDGHEAILHDVVGSIAPSTVAVFDLQEASLLPPGWALVTELALRAALWTRFSDAEVTADRVFIRGVTTDVNSWADARSRLQASMLSGMRLETRVIELPEMRDYEALCRWQFDAVLATRTLEFKTAESTLDSGAEALLDNLLEIAADCPDATILVRANGDGPAIVMANRLLALARSQAIVAYLVERGLSPARINVLATSDSESGRARAVSFTVNFAPVAGDSGAAGTASP